MSRIYVRRYGAWKYQGYWIAWTPWTPRSKQVTTGYLDSSSIDCLYY